MENCMIVGLAIIGVVIIGIVACITAFCMKRK